MIGLLVTLILFPLAGWSLGRRSIGEAFLFGAGLTGLLLFLAGVVHAPLVVALALIVVWGVGTAVWELRHGSRPPSTSYPRLPTILMAVPLIALIFVAAITPLNDFDGRAFWVLKTKEIARERAIDGPSFRAVTLDPRKNHYPILIPLDGAVILGIAHDFDDRQLRWFYLGLLAALAMLVRERIGSLVSPAAGAWCAAILVWIPQFAVEAEGGALSAYNDLAVAAFAAGAFFELMGEVSRSRGRAVAGLVHNDQTLSESADTLLNRESFSPAVSCGGEGADRRMRGHFTPIRPPHPPSAPSPPAKNRGGRRTLDEKDFGAIRFGLWLAFLVLTKSEGLPFAIVFLAVGAFVFRKRIVASAILAGIVAVALFVWRARIPAGDEEDIIRLLPTIPQKLHNIGDAFAAFPRHMLLLPHWGVFWIAVIVAAVFALRAGSRAARLAIGVIAAMLAVYVLVYIATAWTVSDLIAVTADRLLMHVTGPSLFLLALAAYRTKSM